MSCEGLSKSKTRISSTPQYGIVAMYEFVDELGGNLSLASTSGA